MLEIEAKAWTMTFANAVPFLEASFPVSPHSILDVVGENLPIAGYLVGAFHVASSLEAWLNILMLLLLIAHGDVHKLCYLVSSDRSLVLNCNSWVVFDQEL